ncbi:MAG: hypothetical protein ACYCPQ_00010 [Elusimicrobiota bacterium]
MNQFKKIMTGALFAAGVLVLAALAGRKSLSAQGALASGGLFPNDSGPASINVSSYPEQYQKTYHVFLSKCSVCHTIARPINSEFLEMSLADQAKAKKNQPELFTDPKILKINPNIWSRYVHRMMAKPGCPVGADGKRIWQFLVYDSIARKTGKNFAAWSKSRGKLLSDFKAKHPKRYAEIFEHSN